MEVSYSKGVSALIYIYTYDEVRYYTSFRFRTAVGGGSAIYIPCTTIQASGFPKSKVGGKSHFQVNSSSLGMGVKVRWIVSTLPI